MTRNTHKGKPKYPQRETKTSKKKITKILTNETLKPYNADNKNKTKT